MATPIYLGNLANASAWTTSNGVSNQIWRSWIESSTSASTDHIWCAWYETTSTTVRYYHPPVIDRQQPLSAAEVNERARWDRDLAEQREVCRRLDAEGAASEKAANALLREHLDAEQKADLRHRDYFRVISSDGERVYRINRGQAGNVELLNAKGKAIRRFCIHPRGVPDADAMLAQKLWIETDEAAFLRIANVSELAG